MSEEFKYMLPNDGTDGDQVYNWACLERDALQSKLKDSQAVEGDLMAQVKSKEQCIKIHLRKLKLAEEALETYADHHHSCDIISGSSAGSCTCGFEVALAEIRK